MPKRIKAARLKDLQAKIGPLLEQLPSEPSLPPPPTNPADENCEQFLREETLAANNLGMIQTPGADPWCR